MTANEIDLGQLKPLIDQFLEEAGEHRKIFDLMCQVGFDPKQMVRQCGKTAKEHGFWDAHLEKALQACGLDRETYERSTEANRTGTRAIKALVDARLLGDPTIFLALMVTEMAEAIEAYRKGNRVGKDGMWEELADVVVRLFDFIARYGPDDGVGAYRFMALVAAKMAKNESRPRLHGKSF